MSDYCKHLASILHKAQGVIDPETKQAIDVGGECLSLRQECDALQARVRELEDKLARAEDEVSKIPHDEIAFLSARLAAQGEELTRLREAARRVVDRWDSKMWNHAVGTAEHIDHLRAALGEG